MGIKHSERTNQTFKRALSKYTNYEMNDWDRFDSLYNFNSFSLKCTISFIIIFFFDDLYCLWTEHIMPEIYKDDSILSYVFKTSSRY